MKSLMPLFASLLICPTALTAAAPSIKPLVAVVDLDLDEEQMVTLSDKSQVKVKLVKLNETRDPIRQAVRRAEVSLLINGQPITVLSGMYNLPKTIGKVQVDCSVTSGLNSNGTPSFWGLDKAARIDGCSRFQTLTRVFLPLAVPSLVAVILFTFLTSWNEFLLALMFTQTQAAQTLPIIVASFTSDFTISWT